jgi:hypothetical protein
MRSITYTLWSHRRFDDIVYELEVYVQYSDLEAHYYLYYRHANTLTSRHTEKGEQYLHELGAVCESVNDVFDRYAVPVRVRRDFFFPLNTWVP